MHIPSGQQYKSPGEAYVEGDASSASYFLAGNDLLLSLACMLTVAFSMQGLFLLSLACMLTVAFSMQNLFPYHLIVQTAHSCLTLQHDALTLFLQPFSTWHAPWPRLSVTSVQNPVFFVVSELLVELHFFLQVS